MGTNTGHTRHLTAQRERVVVADARLQRGGQAAVAHVGIDRLHASTVLVDPRVDLVHEFGDVGDDEGEDHRTHLVRARARARARVRTRVRVRVSIKQG